MSIVKGNVKPVFVQANINASINQSEHVYHLKDFKIRNNDDDDDKHLMKMIIVQREY